MHIPVYIYIYICMYINCFLLRVRMQVLHKRCLAIDTVTLRVRWGLLAHSHRVLGSSIKRGSSVRQADFNLPRLVGFFVIAEKITQNLPRNIHTPQCKRMRTHTHNMHTCACVYCFCVCHVCMQKNRVCVAFMHEDSHARPDIVSTPSKTTKFRHDLCSHSFAHPPVGLGVRPSVGSVSGVQHLKGATAAGGLLWELSRA